MKRILSIAAAAVLAMVSVAGAQNAADKNPVVLTVNGEPVHAAEVSMAMSNLSAQMQRMGQKPNQQQLVQIATGRVIDSVLLEQAAKKAGMKANEERVQQSISQIEQQAGGKEKFAETLAGGGMTVQEFTDMLRRMDLAQEYVDAKIKPTVTVTDADVKKFYDENPKMFEHPEEVHARHILIKVPKDADEATKKAAHDKAEKARARALKGEDFSKLAQEVSEGPSAKNGGDLGFFTHDQMVKPFADAAFALSPGQISNVVETRFGYHVIKVEDKRPAGKQSLDEVKDRVKQYLENKKLGDAVNAKLDELRKAAKIEDAMGGGQGGGAKAQ